jgi:ribonucleoside-diphosphate reductase alpha chain
MYKRLIENGHINLFSPNDVPDMYEAYFDDPAEFERLYVKYEKKPELIRGKITAAELFSNTMLERKDTGRIYIMNIDNVNDHSSFIDSVRMSNLCQEITLITTPMATKKSYEIYVPNDQLLKVINQLGTSDVVDKFEIQGI